MSKFKKGSKLLNTLKKLFVKNELKKQTKYINQRFGKDNLNLIDDNIPLDKNRNIDFQRLDTEKKKIVNFLKKTSSSRLKKKKNMGGAVGPNRIL
jgi:hypothetical protein